LNLSEVVTFALNDANVAVVNGAVEPFAFVAYAGEGLRRKPDYSFALTQGPDDPPGAIGLTLPGVDVAGLKLYRATIEAGTSWEEVSCGSYQTNRFRGQGRIVAPVCKTGVFVFAETTPEIAVGEKVYLPLLNKSGQYDWRRAREPATPRRPPCRSDAGMLDWRRSIVGRRQLV
jgi:hypothetical protein